MSEGKGGVGAGDRVVLDWHRRDIEQRCGFRGGKYTDVNMWFASLAAALLTGWLFFVLSIVGENIRKTRGVQLLMERGWTPFAMTTLFILALVILFVKSRKLAFQRKASRIDIFPIGTSFALTSTTALEVLGTSECGG